MSRWFYNVRWLLAGFLYLGILHAAPTQITETLKYPDGALPTGSARIVWQQFTTGAGQAIAAGEVNLTITAGLVSIALEPNDTAVPIGTSYTVTFSLDRGTYTQYWIVPTSGTPVTVASIAVVTLPTVTTTIGLNQISVAGSVKGDLIAFGTSWTRLPVGSNNFCLIADSAQTLGMKWAACAGGGSGDITDVGDCATGACFQAVTANQVFAGPTSGGAAVATTRSLVDADIPASIARDTEVGLPGTDKRVTFYDGTAALAGASMFVWDKTNLRVGVGITVPTAGLHVFGSGATSLTGLGGTPVLVKFESPTGTVPWAMRQDADSALTPTFIWIETSEGNFGRIGATASDTFGIQAQSGMKFSMGAGGIGTQVVIDTTGKFGIGTTSPATLLSLPSSGILSWEVSTGAADIGLARNAAGVIEVNSGTAGTLRDAKLRALELTAASPIVFEGATVDGNETTVVVIDPTAPRTFTLPNANSVAVQPLLCTGTDKVSEITALGAVICTADAGGGGGASTGDAFVTIGHPADLTAERNLVGGVGLSLTDGGANGDVTLATDSSEVGFLLSASAAIDFASIVDGACAQNTFTLTGAALGDFVAPAWPSVFTAQTGLAGTMAVSATNTVQVRICNLSGAAVDLASATYAGGIAR